MPTIGATDYRSGAKERLDESYILLLEERFGGSAYLAGRAVEGMLRGLVWRHDPDYPAGRKRLETGHGLRDLFKLVSNLGVVLEDQDEVPEDVQKVAMLWTNNMRFLPTGKVAKTWFERREIGKRRTMKRAAQDFYNLCSGIIQRCEVLWKD
ncbi:MAG: hypothetical protein ACE15C_18135 [Phycisphaerae bacterium]